MSGDWVVLDVDDTLYLERDYVRSGFAAVERCALEELGVSGVGERCWALFEAGARGNTFDQALTLLGVVPDPHTIYRLVEVYRNHLPQICLLPDVLNAIERIVDGHGKRIAVLTGGPPVAQRLKVAALGIEQRVELVEYAGLEGAARDKPHPSSYERLAARMTARSVTHVGDNPTKDLEGPRAVGWSPIRIRREGSLWAHVPTPAGEVEISTLAEL